MSEKFTNDSLSSSLDALGAELDNIVVETPLEFQQETVFDLLKEDAVKQYLQTFLYGAKPPKRKPLKQIIPGIKERFADRTDDIIKTLDDTGNTCKELAKEIIQLAENDFAITDIEVDNILAQGNDIDPLIKGYLAQCFKERELPDNKVITPEPAAENLFHQPETIQEKLNYIMQYRAWHNDFDKTRDIKRYLKEIAALDPEAGAKARQIYSDGQKLKEILISAYYCGIKNNEQKLQSLVAQARQFSPTKAETNKLKSQFERGQKKAAEIAAYSRAANNFPAPDFDPDMMNPFYIGNLVPSAHWNIFIDETGCIFDESSQDKDIREKDKGKFAAVLLPENSDVEKLSSFHATDSSTDDVVQILEKLLCQSKIRSGIIGVTLDNMAKVPMNYWYNGLERLFDLILRLLPVNGKTVIDFIIEERGSSSSAMVQRCADASLYRLAKADPERAAEIEVKAGVYNKKTTNNETFIDYNGYVDSIACAWYGSRPELVRILKNYGLMHTCLLEGEIQELHTVLDAIYSKDPISAETWTSLVNSPDAAHQDSIIDKILCTLGNRLQSDSSLYQQYLSFTIDHLNSKAINLRKLGKQMDFLKKYQPVEASTSPRLQLLWLTAKLAEANHRGAAVFDAEKRFEKLIKELYAEDAPLTCWATLHLAVKYTNAFEFEKAFELVNNYLSMLNDTVPYAELPVGFAAVFEKMISQLPLSAKISELVKKILHSRPAVPEAITGLQYYGQLFSSRGQHFAFMDDNEKAVADFNKAINFFKRLSSENRDKDISQTSAYLMTALMDLPAPAENDLRNAEKLYFGEDIKQNIQSIAADCKDENKYKLHILMRYIASGKAPAYFKDITLMQKKYWKCGNGHPWEMIEFYRALIADSADERVQHLKKAHKLSQGYDATLHVIDAVILGSLLVDDNSVIDEYIQLVDTCEKELPALGNRINILREQPKVKRPALVLAKMILPFNFR